MTNGLPADPHSDLPRDANVSLNESFSSVTADPRGPVAPQCAGDDELARELGVDLVGIRPANSGGLKFGWSWQETSVIAQLIRVNKDGGGKGRAFGSWASMIRRCYDRRFKGYANYGARGTRVCRQWLGPFGYENFVRDMGARPSLQFSIDRYPDPAGNYTPGNCRWATYIEQANNKRPKLEPFSMLPMSARQAQVLKFIAKHVVSKGYAPTLREIGFQFGIRSTNGVNDHIRALVRKGMLKHSGMKSRANVITVRGWEHVGGRGKVQEYASNANRVTVVQPSKCAKCGASTFDSMRPCVICKVLREESAA